MSSKGKEKQEPPKSCKKYCSYETLGFREKVKVEQVKEMTMEKGKNEAKANPFLFSENKKKKKQRGQEKDQNISKHQEDPAP